VLQWDNVEDKTSVVVYGVGALVVLWLSTSLVSAINGLPLVRVLSAGWQTIALDTLLRLMSSILSFVRS
jgi:hypothetical protein